MLLLRLAHENNDLNRLMFLNLSAYLGFAEKVVCEGREQGTGNSFNYLDILSFVKSSLNTEPNKDNLRIE
ncbi:MAG: hypothetical protein HEQ13_14455 [Dolichospermum sp. DEX189]|nr:hypothetical protein [Dolichospermum sp. DEX189]